MQSSAVKELELKIRNSRQDRCKEIEEKRHNLNLLREKIEAFQELINCSHDLDNAAEIQSLISQTLTSIKVASYGSDALANRMKREHLNIVVAGAARQGKSQMLRMLSGVGSELIPTGDTTFCTAAQSRITNDSTGKIRVHFLSESQFLEKKVFPYYESSDKAESLGLSPKPHSLKEFITSDVPRMQTTQRDAKKDKHYENLVNMHLTLREKATNILPCLNGETRDVTPAKLKPYITKDDSNAIPLYLAVDYVEIHTKFPNSLTEGTTLIDLPGVSEMGPYIRENMKKTIREDADIVLMMKLPPPSGDGFVDYDYELFRMMEQIFNNLTCEIKYQDWLAVILNERTTGNGINTKQVEALLKKGEIETLPQLIRCDCGSTTTVDQMLKSNLDSLLTKTQNLDDAWCNKFFNDYEKAVKQVEDLYSNLSAESGKIIADFDYAGHTKQFLADLRGPVQGSMQTLYDSIEESLNNELNKYADEIFSVIESKYAEISNSNNPEAAEEFPIFTRKRLETDFGGSLSAYNVLAQAGLQQQGAIIALVRQHFKNFLNEKIIHISLDELIATMDKKQAISKICGSNWNSTQNSKDKFKELQKKLESNANAKVRHLINAIDGLLNIDISADGNILPHLVRNQYFQQLDIEQPSNNGEGLAFLSRYVKNWKEDHEYNTAANAVFDKLKVLTTDLFELLKEQDVASNIALVLSANAKLFIREFYFNDTAQNAWEDLIPNLAPEIWQEDFAKAALESERGRQWNRLLNEIRTLIS